MVEIGTDNLRKDGKFNSSKSHPLTFERLINMKKTMRALAVCMLVAMLFAATQVVAFAAVSSTPDTNAAVSEAAQAPHTTNNTTNAAGTTAAEGTTGIAPINNPNTGDAGVAMPLIAALLAIGTAPLVFKKK